MTSTASAVRATGFMIALLAALSAIGQFATNIYLPALPAIAEDLQASAARAQLTLMVFLLVFALTQLIYGPVADRFGRRIVLIFGIVVFIGGSAVCYVAPDIEMLILGRALQAAGGGACTVAARAVVRDLFDGPSLVRVMALIAMLFALVPALSPMIGALMQEFAGWRSVFAVTAVAGVVVAVLLFVRIGETVQHRLPRLDFGALWQGYASLVSHREFMRYAIPICLTFTAMFAFFGGSPHTFINYLDVSPTEYGLYPPMASTGFVIGGLLVRKLSATRSAEFIAWVGFAVLLLAGVIGFLLPALGLVHKAVYVVAVVMFVSGMGVTMPSAMASAMQLFPERAGTASAMLGFLQMAGAGLGSALVAMFQDAYPILAFPLIMLVSVVAAIFFYWIMAPKR